MRRFNRYMKPWIASAALLGLAACGGATPSATRPNASTPPATATIALTQTMPTDNPAPATSAAPTGTDPTTQPAASTSAQANRPYAALPQSRTPEGYYVLGKTDAPVTLMFYSDFL